MSLDSRHGTLKLDDTLSNVDVTGLTHNSNNGVEKGNKRFILNFWGPIQVINKALQHLEFEPYCPFNKDLTISVIVTAKALDSKEASGQMVSVAAGKDTEVRGTGTTTIIDT